MLHSIFPKVAHKFLSMPLLGPVADEFDDWLAASGYTRRSRKHAIQVLRHVDLDLRRRRIGEVARLTHNGKPPPLAVRLEEVRPSRSAM